jgi:nitroimidazol reductase NimA-like FMN-containing flavoprotein (pyridoxamine 5'-phosphate oxidase superfamily)
VLAALSLEESWPVRRALDVIDLASDMAFRELDSNEIDAVLGQERIVRIGFFADGDRYVLPLGYAWMDAFLWGTTQRGRKTQIVERDDRVAFSIDDSEHSLPSRSRSVVGEGRFELISAETAAPVLPVLAQRFPDQPESSRREFFAGLADGTSVFWRIAPLQLSGRQYFDPDEIT